MSLTVCTWHPALYSTVSGVSMSMITLQGRIYVQRTLLFSVALVRLQEAAEQSSVLSHQSVKEERGGAMSRFKEYEEKHRGYADRSGSTLRPDSIVLKSKSIFAANSDKT
jgi:hypothetical protein